MKDSPFKFGTTVSEHAFTDRELESAKLLCNLLNGINTTIISPQRWGKSSFVEKVIADIIHKINVHHEFVDPAFELWFNKQYFNKSYSF